MSVRADLSDEEDLLAAELALGLLDPAERVTAEGRLATDPAFAAAHRRWQERAVAMLDWREEPPRPSVWHAIVERLPANQDQPTDIRRPASLKFWRAATGLSALAAIILATIAIERPAPSPILVPAAPRVTSPLVAVLGAKGRPVVTISFDRASARIVSAPFGLDLHGRAAQLWVIQSDGTPRSLGLIADSKPGATHAPATAAGLIRPGATLAISVEPRGGSPTGLPTGPVIVTGKVSAI